MEHGVSEVTGAWFSGLQATLALAVWGAAVLLYGLFWRSLARAEPDPIRPSGPID